MPYRTTYDAYRRLETNNPWQRAKPAPRQRPDPCEDDCTPVCPACGGLQCLCRPRFFPGQLLTDNDLNRLENYVVEKNKLHNRYLHGWGVACGMEVVCDPCSEGVIVRTGYALSPCGDDIIVYSDQAVDVCELINRCAPSGEPQCEDPFSQPPKDCSGKAKRWVLAICYDEQPKQGVTARLGLADSVCGNRCGCGGSGCPSCGGNSSPCHCGKGGGCSCGDPGNTMNTTTRPGGTYKPECEPTQICEGYRFIAYPATEPLRRPKPQSNYPTTGISGNLLWSWMYANRSRFGPLMERVLCCVTRAMELRAEIREGRKLDSAVSIGTYTDYASALKAFAADFSIHRCGFVPAVDNAYDGALSWARTISANPSRFSATELSDRVRQLDNTWLNVVSECFCSALLPGCPPQPAQNCVPLAVVTIGGERCRIVDICNWQERKILISWPSLTYWLSWLPWHRLRQWISGLCCSDDRDRGTYQMLMVMFGAAFSGLSTASAANQPAVSRMAAISTAGSSRLDPLNAGLEADNLLEHLLGEFDKSRSGHADAGAHSPWSVLASRLTDGSAFAPLVGEEVTSAELGRRIENLRAEFEQLRKSVDPNR